MAHFLSKGRTLIASQSRSTLTGRDDAPKTVASAYEGHAANDVPAGFPRQDELCPRLGHDRAIGLETSPPRAIDPFPAPATTRYDDGPTLERTASEWLQRKQLSLH
jgi:hypothetical protein